MKKLKPRGVFVTQSCSAHIYGNVNGTQVFSLIFNTLRSTFPRVLTVFIYLHNCIYFILYVYIQYMAILIKISFSTYYKTLLSTFPRVLPVFIFLRYICIYMGFLIITQKLFYHPLIIFLII